jgi:hypothetical protein
MMLPQNWQVLSVSDRLVKFLSEALGSMVVDIAHLHVI